MAQHRVSPTQARVLALLASGERLIHYRKFRGVPTHWFSSETGTHVAARIVTALARAGMVMVYEPNGPSRGRVARITYLGREHAEVAEWPAPAPSAGPAGTSTRRRSSGPGTTTRPPATRPAPHQYVVTQAIYDGIVDLGAEPVLPHINLVITVREEEIPCGYNGGRPCDYTGRGGKGYCEGCCRYPW